MLSTLLFLALSSVLIEQTLAGATCNLDTPPATWARVLAKNAFFNAWQPNDYFDLPGFCVNNDFMSHSLNYSSHVNLADSTIKVQQDVVLTSTFSNKSPINCGQTVSNVQWCQSHCADKKLEALIVSTSVINGSLPLATAQQVYTTLGSPNDTAIASIQVDLNKQDFRIDYDYFDDVNFCSVVVKVKNPSMFPYGLFVTVQKIIVG